MRSSSRVIVQIVSFLASLRDLPADAGFICNEAPVLWGTIKQTWYVSWEQGIGLFVGRWWHGIVCFVWTGQHRSVQTQTQWRAALNPLSNAKIDMSVCLSVWVLNVLWAPNDTQGCQVSKPYQPIGIQNRNNVTFQVFWDVTLYLRANTSLQNWPRASHSIPTGAEQLAATLFPISFEFQEADCAQKLSYPKRPFSL